MRFDFRCLGCHKKLAEIENLESVPVRYFEMKRRRYVFIKCPKCKGIARI